MKSLNSGQNGLLWTSVELPLSIFFVCATAREHKTNWPLVFISAPRFFFAISKNHQKRTGPWEKIKQEARPNRGKEERRKLRAQKRKEGQLKKRCSKLCAFSTSWGETQRAKGRLLEVFAAPFGKTLLASSNFLWFLVPARKYIPLDPTPGLWAEDNEIEW